MTPNYAELAQLEKELSSLISEKEKIEKKMIDLKAKISELKVTLSNSNRDEDVILDCPKPVIPEVPQHLNRRDNLKPIQLMIDHNYNQFVRYNKSINDAVYFGTLGELLSRIGRELIIYKTDIEYSKSEQKTTEDIMKTCDTVSFILYRGDIQGYNKYISFLDSKFAIPGNPFVSGNEPYDFFLSDSESIFRNVYYLSYYLSYFKDKIKKYDDTDFLFDSKINTAFVYFLHILHELRKNHYGIGIIPIFNKNIINRSAKEAQKDDNCISFLFDPNYVDIPELADSSITEPVYGYSSSKAVSSYVTSHFRRGHFRNGSWVNGGFVQGHFRRY